MTVMTMTAYQPDRSLGAKVRRRLTRWSVAEPLRVQPKRSYVCFTFDDFPKSAADTGAEILDEVDAKGCFYACTGMAGTSNQMGRLFDAEDLTVLRLAGHEIGAHTESHLDCARASDEKVLADIRQNLTNLDAMGHDLPVTQFAWPYGETRTRLKPKLTERFHAVRGVLAGTNRKGADLMQLSAYELDENDANIERAAAAIEHAARHPAWIFIFTHDVREKHSAWGVAPDKLRRLVRLARDTGAEMVTPSMALAAIQGNTMS
ncbi:polysaccharide deacetylase family protein [Henriciella aquimarina]|uniref:polysaccharide deacetylase family protein n=1 Tax=Henriciella aquimarina TaxID=545261 RepID=UPI000A04886A|nr:polysaccharide deacetylase family protein [Henriciella aquimarina]